MEVLSLSTVLLGIASSLASEIISWLNKKLFGTVFQGQAALLVSVLAALFAGMLKVFVFSPLNVISIQDLLSAFIVAFGWSQLWFTTIATWFGLQVKNG